MYAFKRRQEVSSICMLFRIFEKQYRKIKTEVEALLLIKHDELFDHHEPNEQLYNETT